MKKDKVKELKKEIERGYRYFLKNIVHERRIHEKYQKKKDERREGRKIRAWKKMNKKIYAKKKKLIDKERKKIGEEKAYFRLVLMKNHKRVETLYGTFFKTKAYAKYNELIEENNSKVQFPIIQESKVNTRNREDVKYELLMIKKTYSDEIEVSQFRNDDGMFIDNILVDSEGYKIIEKHKWLVEETFYVYGYHPRTDRKEYSFIYNNLVINTPDYPDYMKRILLFKNKLIIDTMGDFDFVICKNIDEAKRLYIKLEKDIMRDKRKYVVFTGIVKATAQRKWLEKIHEKTGWDYLKCQRYDNSYCHYV